MTSVASAVENDNPRILTLMVAVPGSVKKKDMDNAFLNAVKWGFCDCLECLLSVDVDIGARDANDNSAIHLSVMFNRPGILEMLIRENCEVNSEACGRNTPLHIAAKHGHDECLEILVRNGANLNVRDSAGNTALILAVKNSQYICIGTLLRAGCDVDAKNNDGKTALQYSCHKARGYDKLLCAGANPDIPDNDGNTPLIMASSEGFDKVVKSLIDAKCAINVTSSSVRRTALHILSLKGHAEGVNDLISAGADVNLYDSQSHTPLWYAVKNKRYDIVKLLLQANCQVDTFQCLPDISQEACPTRLALSQGSISIMKDFILTGYDKAHLKCCLKEEEMLDIVGKHDGIDLWLDHAHDPLHLKQICRLWIRHYLGNVFFHNLKDLPLPSDMKDFLLMKELDINT